MVNGFLQYIRYEKIFSSHTVLSYHTDLRQFLEFLGMTAENFDPEAVKSTDIQSWIMHLMESGITARSISRKISVLKSFWRYLLRYHQVKINPTLKIVLPKTIKPLPVFFKHREVSEVIDNPFVPDDFVRLRDLLIVETFYMTGIRLSELISITDKNLDFSSAELRVIGKRNKERIIPLDMSLCQKMSHYRQLRDAAIGNTPERFFVRESGKSLYPALVQKIVKRIMSEVSTLSHIGPHMLRHTFATELLNGGADINAVKELMGHSSLAATQVYTHTSFKELYNIYKQAHPRAKLRKGGIYETENSVN